MIFGLLFDNDKASHYISKLENKFYANTEKQEQVPVKAETSGTTACSYSLPWTSPTDHRFLTDPGTKWRQSKILWTAEVFRNWRNTLIQSRLLWYWAEPEGTPFASSPSEGMVSTFWTKF